MSPTTILLLGDTGSATASATPGAGEVYPGWGMTGGLGGAIPGTHQAPSQYPYLVIFLRLGPTYGQMKAFYRLIDEVS